MLYNFLLGLDKTLLLKANNKVVTLSPKNYHQVGLTIWCDIIDWTIVSF